MSAICGVLWRDGRPDAATELAAMVTVLSHWKPDAIGTQGGPGWGLGQLALWSTPEAASEKGPVCRAESGVVIAADARIDNREELACQLGLDPTTLARTGDGELIARAYEKWGTECATRLVGDFAFALWDPRVRRFFCARDPMGMRPFFYFLDDRRFLFGSEIKALFTEPGMSRALDFLHLANALSGLPSCDDRTPYQAVRMLEPATALCVEAAQSRRWKFWALEMEREIRLPCDDDYVDAFDEIMQQAVRARLRAHGRVGSLLSGGLDATTCLGLALRRGNIPRDRLSAFSWALREDDDWWIRDERPFIDAFLAEHPVDHAYIFPDASRMFDLPERMRAHRDGPEWRMDHCQMAPTLAEAERRGVRVLLNGTGGDEAASYAAPDFLLGLLLAGDWPALRAEVASGHGKTGASRWRVGRDLLRPLVGRNRLLTPFNYQWTYRRRCERAADPTELSIPLNLELAREVDFAGYVRDVARPRLRGAWRHPFRADQVYVLTRTHVLCEQVAAWDYSASYGIECRCPYLDRRVLEFAVAVPPRQHRFAGVPRRLLRRVAKRHLPEKIYGRLGKSPTMPDLDRSLCARQNEWQEQIAGWRGNPRVTAIVDLDRLVADLRIVVENTAARSAEWAPVMPFCRGMLLATFIASM